MMTHPPRPMMVSPDICSHGWDGNAVEQTARACDVSSTCPGVRTFTYNQRPRGVTSMGMGVVDKDEILRELMSVLEDGSSCNVNMTGVKKEEEEEESDATLFDSLSQGAVKEEWEWEKEEEEVCTELPQEHSAHEEERGRKKKKQRKTSKAKNLPAVRSNNKRALDARWDEEMLRHKDFNGVVKPYIERHLSKADRTHFMKARRRYLNRTYREKKLEREPSAAKAVRLQAEENGRLQQELDTQEQCLEDLRAKINALKEFMRQSDIPF